MSNKCEICGKTALKGNKVSFSNKHTITRQNPNLQSIKIDVNGVVKKVKVCTSCIRANKVKKSV